jgi:hypothetical protein
VTTNKTRKSLISIVGIPKRDLSDIAGTWREDAAFDSALAAQDTIDPELWDLLPHAETPPLEK